MVVVCRADAKHSLMAVPPEGDPKPHPTNLQGVTGPSRDDFQPIIPCKRRRNASKLANEPLLNPEFASIVENGGRVMNQEVRQLIHSLQEVITNQNNVIEAARIEIWGIKASQEELKEQNNELQEEVRTLRVQIEDLQKTAAEPKLWAAVAASSSTPTMEATTIENPRKDPKCVRLSMEQVPDNDNAEGDRFARYLPTDRANKHIRTALLNAETTKDVQVAGIGLTRTGYVIRFTNKESADTARTNLEWIQELGNGTKLVKPCFGIVVHHTLTEGFDLDGDKQQAINMVMEENDLATRGYQVEDLAWLKNPNKPLGKWVTLGIWLDTAEAAQWIINNGLLVGQRYFDNIIPYSVKQKRCYRCQRFGHLAWACQEPARCGHCTGWHERCRCPPGVRVKCLDCNGDHPTGEWLCPTPCSPGYLQ